MKSFVLVCLVGVLALGLAGTARAEDNNAGKAATGTPAVTTPDTPATPAKQTRVERAAAEVKVQVDLAEKAMKAAADEMAKPEDKRNAKTVQNCKMLAAVAYYHASTLAKRLAGNFAKTDDKEGFLAEHEKTNLDKAVSILLELAQEARTKKDFKTAQGLYTQVLQWDPSNAIAKAGLEGLQKDMKTAQSAGGSSDNNLNNQKNYQGYKGSYNGSSWNTWSGGGGYGGYGKY
jgi:hypothetical protein